MGAWEDLVKLLRESGAPVTLDMKRDTSKPCVVCQTSAVPRRLYKVVEAGETVGRPICEECAELTGAARWP